MNGDVIVQVSKARLIGRLIVPQAATGVIVFAHASGSGRHSARSRYVADVLHRAGLGTLLFDLLTMDEEAQREKVYDIALLAGRLMHVIRWLADGPTRRLPVGLFGTGTSAAAAFRVAAEPDLDIAALVSRGGRPDLVGSRLEQIRAPTLLIAGGLDHLMLNLNRTAQTRLRCPHELVVVPGATYLFEEAGTLQAAAALAARWFLGHLTWAGPATTETAGTRR